jgi:twinkle protein
MERYGVKTKIVGEKPYSLGFQYANGSYKLRKFDVPKHEAFSSLGDISKAGLFGKDKFHQGGAKYVTITEGELDALSLNQALGSKSPVVSVQSSGVSRRDCVLDYDWLNSFERIYLALDNDEPGQKAAREIASLFAYDKVYHVRFDRRKDANEYLQAGEEEELKRIWWNSRRFLPEGMSSQLEEFDVLVAEQPQKGASYPFQTLNEMTYGIRPGEIVLIKALEGVGKTELLHTIQHSLLRETDDGIGTIHLEESKGDLLRALAGIELKAPIRLPGYPYSQSEVSSALRQIIRVDDRLHVCSYNGSDDPELLLDTVRFLGVARGCRFICIDPLSMVFSAGTAVDERKAIDTFMTKLSKMGTEVGFSTILTAHLNSVGLTRGSTYPDKVAHTVIVAERNVKGIDPEDGRLLTSTERNTLHLTLIKNRFGSKTGPAGDILFDPQTFTLAEI